MARDKWTPTRFGELASVTHGWPFKSELFSEELTGKPIIVSIGNFRYTGGFRFESTTTKEYRGEYPKSYELRSGDTLLVMTCQTSGGEILGIPARVPNDGRVYLHNQRMGKIVIKNEKRFDADFAYWLCLWQKFNHHLATSASGTKILHTSPGRIEDFRFDLPPLPTQRAIAGVLGALDEKIEVNRGMARTLEAAARALFESWFVRFEHPATKAYAAPLADSPMRPIPEGWRVGTLGEVAKERREGVTAGAMDGSMHYIALEHMPRRSIALAEWSDAADVVSNKLRFDSGDILFGKLRPYFHKVGVAPVSGVCSTDIVVAQPVAPEWFGFVLGVMSSVDFVAHTDRGSAGTKMPRTNWTDMAAYRVALPPVELAARYTALIRPLIDRIIAGIHECRTLSAMRDALLPKLISGELAVPEALGRVK